MVLEAPGSDQRAVVAALVAAGLPVAGVNPRHARDVAKATGPWAQTEALDARAVGKAAKVALKACMRTRLTIPNARVTHHASWPPEAVLSAEPAISP